MWLSTSSTCSSLAFCLLAASHFSLGYAKSSDCGVNFHECGDGRCLEKSHVCDGVADCSDGSDEVDCDYLLCKSPFWFECDNSKCISHAFVCDENDDCGDWSDEKHDCSYQHQSPINRTCETGEFKCADGICIPFDWICNGREDCPDGSDEKQNCNMKSCDGFHCANGQCIISEFRCDGSADCYDGSDEVNCPANTNSLVPKMSECLVERGYFACSDKVTCIPLSSLCNNHTDCLGGEDEGITCETNKNDCTRAGCSHRCQISPKGPLCSCPEGYKLKEGSLKICEDIDECKIYGTCGQRCHNWAGGYACSCEGGYILASDEKTCLTEEVLEATLVYSSSKEIRSYTLTSQHLSKVQSKQSDVVAVAFDGQNVYWSSQENGRERIMKSRADGSKKEAIVNAGLGQPEDMAWDWVTKKIYFTDSIKKTISVCTDDGQWCSILINTKTDMPHGIVVVPQEGTMFWTDWGAMPHIGKAGMDGTNPTMFIEEDLQWPNSIALDYGNNRLYWVDAKFHFIESVNLDGSDRRVVLKLPVSDAFSIALFESKLYWSDFKGKEISSCDKFTGKNHTTIVTDAKNTINGIHIFHEALQPKIHNPCEAARCSHMCVLAPRGKFSCKCPPDMTLEKDSMTCGVTAKSTAILVGAGDKLIKIEHQRLGKINISHVILSEVQNISAITYNPVSNAVIVSDAVSKTIVSYSLKKLKYSTLIDSQIGYVVDMEYDYAGRNLYWCDFERQVIEVYSFATKERVVVIRDLHGNYPVSIAITPTGFLFVGLSSNHHNHIDHFNLDGQGHTHAMEELTGPPAGLTFHRGLQRVFWVDDVTGTFTSTDDEALDKHEWRKEQNEPVSMAALGPLIFWTSKGSNYLHWADVHTGQSKMTKLKLDVDKVPAMYLATMDQPPLTPHACQVDNGGCSHVCFALQSGVKCGCPLGMHLKNDGHTCTSPSHCSKKEFKCFQDDLCIPKSLRCNGHVDCLSGEDEDGCESATCEPGTFTCANGDCVMQHQRCDGHADCKDKSDEENCMEHIACDSDTEFTCHSGECISRTLLCDTINDCSDNSDELYCQDTSCSAEEFRCHDGICIPSTWECDGALDCKDGSDEHSKCEKEKCMETDFTCANGNCVDQKVVGDGQNDCGDASDEVNEENGSRESSPTNAEECAEDFFKCESASKALCLPESARCNGTVECPFGDDESDCGCREGTFSCPGSKKCIPEHWRCDGYSDCPGGTDEETCSDFSKTSPEPRMQQDCEEFRCTSGQCLRFSKVCDGKKHCEDGSDEGGRCGLACDKNNNPCSHICLRTPKGPRCSCESGFFLSGDGRTCLDIDECETDPELCSHFCRNTPGSFVCSCAKGYSLKSDRQSCKAVGGSLDAIFVTNEEIRKLSFKSKKVSILTSHTGLTVSGLAVDSRNHHVYWSTASTGKLTRMSQANEVEQQIEKIVEKPKRLALDWVTSNIYVVDQLQFPTIKVCNVDKERCAKIYSAFNANEVTSMVLDPSQGYLFWSELSSSEKSSRSEIWRSDMDGKNATVIVSARLAMVSGLALDLVKKQIYWADQGQGVIEFASYEGSKRQLLPIKDLQRPVGVALFEDNIYWLEGSSGKFSKRSLKYPYTRQHVELHAYDAVHFQLVHEALQPEATNVCNLTPCNEGLCVLTPFGAKCICESPEDCIKIASTTSVVPRSGSSAGAVLAALFLTILVMVTTAGLWYFLIKRQGKTLEDMFNFKNLQFENASFGGNIFTQGIRFSATKLNPTEHQFINPAFRGQQSPGFEQQPLKTVLTKCASSTPPVPSRRTIPVDITPCSSESSGGSPELEMSPITNSPHACLISVDD